MQRSLRILELYSGIGGMHFALIAAGIPHKVIAAFDINTTANEVYKCNFPETNMVQKNLEGLSVEDLAEINADLIVMSPPCQPFTRTGLQEDDKDKRSASFLHLIHLIARLDKLPKFLLLENVKGFDTSNTHQIFLDTLKKCNYHWQEFILSPLQFCIPNSRLRYYLIAKLKSIPFCFTVLEEIMECFPVKLGHLRSFFPNCTFNQNKDIPLFNTTDSKSKSDSFVQLLHNYLDQNMDENYIEKFLVPDKVLIKYFKVMDIVREEDNHSCCFTKAYGHYVEGTGSILCCSQKIDFSDVCEKLSHLRNDDEVTKILLLKTLKLRYFTPREIANIHCFPHSFELPPSITVKQQYKVLGNSLNIFVVASLLQLLILEKII